MIDIIGVDGDIQIYDTQNYKAKNILNIQLGSLEYAQDLGIDLKYFLDDELRFQNESFKAYLIEVLANNGINLSSLVESIEALYTQYTFNIVPAEYGTGLMAR